MKFICIQCALRCLVNNDRAIVFEDETFEQHMAREHPDPAKTVLERRELERRLMTMLRDHDIHSVDPPAPPRHGPFDPNTRK